jgi:mono/diheme cytochrome c family protein
MLEVSLFLLPWLLLGAAITFIAFSGGPGEARQAYLTGGRRFFRVAIPILYIACGIAVPALVIADRGQATGATDQLRAERAKGDLSTGKQLFRQSCATCHDLDAVNARGVTGPDLDEIGTMSAERVLLAIENGGTGQDRMPAGLLEGEAAGDVARYVEEVAGK